MKTFEIQLEARSYRFWFEEIVGPSQVVGCDYCHGTATTSLSLLIKRMTVDGVDVAEGSEDYEIGEAAFNARFSGMYYRSCSRQTCVDKVRCDLDNEYASMEAHDEPSEAPTTS